MKRYDLECGYGGGDRLVASVDGVWIRYEDHVEAMKRIAGDGGQQAGDELDLDQLREDTKRPNAMFSAGIVLRLLNRIAAPAPVASHGEVVVTWDQGRTRILAVTRQDDEGQILSVIAEAPSASPADQEPCGMICERGQQNGKACGIDCERDIERDAARYRWMKAQYLAADFDWQGQSVLVFKFPRYEAVSADCDDTIDRGMSATPPATESQD